MSRLYAPFLNLAPRLIALAKTVTFTYVTRGAYDPATGVGASTTAQVTIKAVVEEFSDSEFGDTIQEGDIKLTVAAKSFTEPKVDDRVVVDGVSYSIVEVDPLAVGINPVAYTLHARMTGEDAGGALVGGFDSGFDAGFSGGAS